MNYKYLYLLGLWGMYVEYIIHYFNTFSIMKKLLSKVVMAVAAVLLLASCGVNANLTTNRNLNQTNVVLAQKNFHVVKNVEAEVTAEYWFGLGGLGKQALQGNALAELTKEANLTGSQALVNVTLHVSAEDYIIYSKLTYHATGTVVEFDE